MNCAMNGNFVKQKTEILFKNVIDNSINNNAKSRSIQTPQHIAWAYKIWCSKQWSRSQVADKFVRKRLISQ